MMLCLAGAASAFAQGQGNATLTGTVVDNVGVVPGATITVTNRQRRWSARDDRAGLVPYTPCRPGAYTVKVEMDGFKQIDSPTSVARRAKCANSAG